MSKGSWRDQPNVGKDIYQHHENVRGYASSIHEVAGQRISIVTHMPLPGRYMTKVWLRGVDDLSGSKLVANIDMQTGEVTDERTP